MSQVILLAIGYHHLVLPNKPAVAGKLMELLAGAIPVERRYSGHGIAETYLIKSERANVSITLIDHDQVRRPRPGADDPETDTVEAFPIKALPSGVKRLNAPRS